MTVTMTKTHWLATLVVVLLMCGSTTAARADEPRSAYRLSFELDAPLLLLAGGVAASFLVMNETGPPACAPLCDSANVNRIDRHFAGTYSETWTRVGDITTASVLVLVPVGLLIGEPSRAGLKDLVVVAEASIVPARASMARKPRSTSATTPTPAGRSSAGTPPIAWPRRWWPARPCAAPAIRPSRGRC
jgi:hypothetical protein